LEVLFCYIFWLQKLPVYFVSNNLKVNRQMEAYELAHCDQYSQFIRSVAQSTVKQTSTHDSRLEWRFQLTTENLTPDDISKKRMILTQAILQAQCRP